MTKKKNNRRSNEKSNPKNQSNRKKRFEVQEGETLDQCLERIKREGYTPVRRVEEPVFQEVSADGEASYQPVGRKIIFDTIASKPNDQN